MKKLNVVEIYDPIDGKQIWVEYDFEPGQVKTFSDPDWSENVEICAVYKSDDCKTDVSEEYDADDFIQMHNLTLEKLIELKTEAELDAQIDRLD